MKSVYGCAGFICVCVFALGLFMLVTNLTTLSAKSIIFIGRGLLNYTNVRYQVIFYEKLFSGQVIASSKMGITVFDLFGEIMTVDDMHRFLKKMGVNEGYSGAALILRSFLVLMDLNKVCDSVQVHGPRTLGRWVVFYRALLIFLSKLRFMTTRPFRSPWTTDP